MLGRSFSFLEELARVAQQIAELSASVVPIVAEEGGELNGDKAEARWCRQDAWDVA